jgi:hypothetical protein
MAILNQGFVQELNLDETIDEAKAINNLATGSISEDLTVFAGNSSNQSEFIWINPSGSSTDTAYSFNPTESSFKFNSLIAYGNGDPIKQIKPVHLIADATWTQSGISGFITITTNMPHGIDPSASLPIVELENTRFDISGSSTNGQYQVSSVVSSTKFTIAYDTNPGALIESSVYNSWITYEDLQLPSPLSKNQVYYIVYSNSFNEFKVDDSYVEIGINNFIAISSPINVDIVFVRSNKVEQQNLLYLINPEINDEGFSYSFAGGGTIDEKFETLEGNIDSSNFLRTKKLRVDGDNYFKDRIRLEGNLRIFDPDPYNQTTTNLFDEKSGVYITNPSSSLDDIQKLRAFSSNANPWTVEVSSGDLVTQSNEMNIGDLTLNYTGASTATLLGLQNVTTTSSTDETSFQYKLPVTINGEIYFVLLRS